jgi:ribosomal protein S27E
MSPALAAGTAERDWGAELYQRRRPEQTLLYQIVEQHYPAFVTHMVRQERPLPDYVQQEFEDYLRCGRLEYGFLRVRCDTCHAEHLVAFSCRRRGFCPSCGARRMAESAALLVDEVFPEQPVRQWGEGRPFVRWTNAARRTAGQEVWTGTWRQGRLLPPLDERATYSPAAQRSWAKCSALSIGSSPAT